MIRMTRAQMTRAAVVGGTLLMLLACAPVADMSTPAQGVQAAPGQPNLTVSGSARVGVTRTLN